MDDHTPEPAGESVGEFRDHGAAPLVQDVDTAVQVDHRQVPMGRYELQNMIKLAWRVRVHLGGQAHLGETEPCELEERIVACDASLEQGMNGLRHLLAGAGVRRTGSLTTWPGTIHDLHSTPS
jgi:hypothetical protein